MCIRDRHTAALDPATADKVLALTRKIVRENTITTLMINHNIQSCLLYTSFWFLRHLYGHLPEHQHLQRPHLSHRPVPLLSLIHILKRSVFALLRVSSWGSTTPAAKSSTRTRQIRPFRLFLSPWSAWERNSCS